MPRISRKCYESDFFHVMVQGIDREFIFNNDYFKEKYLSFLQEASQKHQVKIIAYCMMDNHAHILVYTPEIDKLSDMMESTNTKFAILYNKRCNRCGYVFRDRYRCENILSQAHLEICIRYIHRNPIKAGICEFEWQYPYSSYNLFVDRICSSEYY